MFSFTKVRVLVLQANIYNTHSAVLIVYIGARHVGHELLRIRGRVLAIHLHGVHAFRQFPNCHDNESCKVYVCSFVLGMDGR